MKTPPNFKECQNACGNCVHGQGRKEIPINAFMVRRVVVCELYSIGVESKYSVCDDHAVFEVEDDVS